MNKISNIESNLIFLNHDALSEVLLYGDVGLDNETNTKIINVTIEYILNSERFNLQLFESI